MSMVHITTTILEENESCYSTKKEIRQLDKFVQQKGYTLVPLKLYFKRGNAKILIGVAKGKKSFDKRDSIKEKDLKRQLDRNVKGTYKVNL